MHATTLLQSTTPISTVSSLSTNNAINATTSVQSGPYTKAQFQTTMEGSRSVKNAKEVEQLLRDYPAALELYRTGRYKVKIKNEADVERVILVEKRTNKTTANTLTKTNEFQQNDLSIPDISTQVDKKRETSKEDQSRSRTHSHERTPLATSIPDNNAAVQSTGSSIRLPSNAQPKVDHHRTPSKERDASITSRSNQQQQQQQQPEQQQQQTQRRSHSRDSRSKLSYSKQKGKKSNRDYQNAIVPYAPNANPAANMWHPSRAPQPYFSNPTLSHQPLMPNIYMPTPFLPQPYPGYQHPYYYGQQPYPALVYQRPTTYPTSSTIKSAGTMTNKTVPGLHNYPSPPQPRYNPNQGATLPPAFHTFHPNQQQYSHPQAMYHSQLPYQMPGAWPTTSGRHAGPIASNHSTYTEGRQGSKHRARSVDTGPRVHGSVRLPNLPQPPPPPQQPAIVVTEHHHHRHHHHRPQPPTIQVDSTGPSVETGKDQNTQLRDITITASPNKSSNGEKLTIRQLNEIFHRTDPSGRLPYSSLPNILQRFGIALTESDLTTAAQKLDYNTNDPLSARRLVHVLVDLGKIAKSTQQQQQRPPASPLILPEDREVNDIMTQRRVVGNTTTHIHSSIYPNHWY